MNETKIRNDFRDSLIEIYNFKMINTFLQFLQGEQAVLFALKFNIDKQPSNISKHLGFTKSRMTSIVNKLLSKGMITVSKDEKDKRKQILNLTEKGDDYITKKVQSTNIILDSFFDKMGNDKIIEFTKLLKETIKHMNEVEKYVNN
ncbi:MarR family winged helix-turn-helix transcriptional regulator [Haploplasma axanthum]|uniref:Transcriptional repressor MprA n=1 Tax=Haploplasma axanthum TaxID=29552 RepID=A0A449BF40_HAPAX|nr:MarR family winged helix-turn-helix transcriptional regulator [Haploplasma axanthum]VEU81052.1 transcriptional repressor MprA [Haploplasma axanthum]